jgi:hypothetical protein
MHAMQSYNLASLYFLDQSVLLQVLADYFTFLVAIFTLTLVFKLLQTQRSVRGLSIVGDDARLFWRLWLSLVLSQVVYLGVSILIIWNYSPVFFEVVKFYSIYSSFICVRAIANS